MTKVYGACLVLRRRPHSLTHLTHLLEILLLLLSSEVQRKAGHIFFTENWVFARESVEFQRPVEKGLCLKVTALFLFREWDYASARAH